jgi:tetratricopeptide (TPR) repeat protein
MSPENNTIVVNVKAGVGASTTSISGKLDVKFTVQAQCEKILASYDQGKKRHARLEVKKLLEIYPNDKNVQKLYIWILFKDRLFVEAYKKIKVLLNKFPEEVFLINLQGLIQRQLDLFEDAMNSYKQAIELNPDYADSYNNLAIIYRYFGQKDLAIQNFRKAIAINNQYCAAFYNLSCMKGYELTKKEINTVKGLLTKVSSSDDIVRCHFSLYNAYLSKGDNTKAIKHLKLGNDRLSLSFGKKKPLLQFVKAIKKNYDLDFYKNYIKLQPFYKSPFFIVGMPRSGSTLLEQILSSHPKVYGLGESKIMPKILFEIDPHIESNIPKYLDAFKKLDSGELKEKVDQYKNKIQHELVGGEIYTDKMLKNFKFIGFIKILLPNAKFIHIKRNALDNCFSCYEKKFTQGHEYTYDLTDLGEYYSAHIELMEYWKSIFPEDIHEVKYEELVLDSKNVIKTCLEFMNLKMDKACLEFYRNERRVFTASTDQVREKINKKSIGKWKKFKKELQPLIDELNKGGVDLS